MLAGFLLIIADDPESSVRVGMKTIKIHLILYSDHDHHSNGHAEAESKYVDKGDEAVPLQHTDRNFQIIPEHSVKYASNVTFFMPDPYSLHIQ